MTTRFIVMPMPLNAEGNGPASMEETVRETFEVWDAATYLSLSSFDDEPSADAWAETANTVATYLESLA